MAAELHKAKYKTHTLFLFFHKHIQLCVKKGSKQRSAQYNRIYVGHSKNYIEIVYIRFGLHGVVNLVIGGRWVLNLVIGGRWVLNVSMGRFAVLFFVGF